MIHSSSNDPAARSRESSLFGELHSKLDFCPNHEYIFLFNLKCIVMYSCAWVETIRTNNAENVINWENKSLISTTRNPNFIVFK